jgi:hypothetical protein
MINLLFKKYYLNKNGKFIYRLTSNLKGTEHHMTILRNKDLKVVTIKSILNDISEYLEMDKEIPIKNLSKIT